MKRVLTWLLAALALSGGAATAQSTYTTGNRLLEGAQAMRRADANRTKDGDAVLLGWFFGFSQGTALALDRAQFCLPDDSTTSQWAEVLAKHLESNPAELHKPGTTLAIAAFRKAFPCPQK
jgi:hypothetical protein